MKSVIREFLITVLLALVLFGATNIVVRSTEVQGFSMEPNIHDGQRIIISKASFWFSNPQRGDVVVFHSPEMDTAIIHRVVGLPGESIKITQGELYINGEKLEESYLQGNSISAPLKAVPEDSYFIVGDNRGAARWDIVPRDDIVGKALLSYWPMDEWGLVTD